MDLHAPHGMTDAWHQVPLRQTSHRDGDDLLTAGLGAAGLLAAAPGFVDPQRPTAAEQRRRAIWSNWRGIADLPHAGGSIRPVAGIEVHASLRLPGARHRHRVMLQLPDDFDDDLRCLLVCAASGSRGIYGAVAVASAWGLPRGCAVVTTDKGAGCDWFDLDQHIGFALDGTPTGDVERMLFRPAAPHGGGVAIPHAHSGDNPEADWCRHLKQAAEFALAMLDRLRPGAAPFRFDDTQIVAVGLSNAGGAVLRAAGDSEPWLSGVVAAAPNVLPPSGGRALYDYATEAAIWMSAAHAAPACADAPQPLPLLGADAIARQRDEAIDALQARGLLRSGDRTDAACQALRRLQATGWSLPALRAGVLSASFDMWRAVGVTYASAYGRYPVDAHPCGYRFAMLDAAGRPRPSTAAERTLWWSDGAGIVPGVGVDIVDPRPDDPWAGRFALRALFVGSADPHVQPPRVDDHRRVTAGIAATRASLPRPGLPLLVMHGSDDGLIPEQFSSAPYVQACRDAGRAVTYWQIHGAQHFDPMLALPAVGAAYRPLLPALHAGLDAMLAHLRDGRALPPEAPD